LQVSLDQHDFKGKKILRVLIPRGDDPPYALDDNKIYVRDEAETGLAVRDEIVGLVMRSSKVQQPPVYAQSETSPLETVTQNEKAPTVVEPAEDVAPRTGVEVLPNEEREGTRTYSMRDLRNGNIVKNVTRSSARRLWHYGITRFVEIANNKELAGVQWQGDFGMLKRYSQGKSSHYDLVQKTQTGYRYYFGVTSDGIHGPWKNVVGEEEN
jgi:hypothetical protein